MLDYEDPDPEEGEEAAGEDEAVADAGLVGLVSKEWDWLRVVVAYLDGQAVRVEEEAKDDAG